MFRKIIEKREQRKKDKFYKKGFKEGSNDILIFLTDGPINAFSSPIEVMDRMTEYMISYKDAELRCNSGNSQMIKAFMSGYNNAAVKIGILIKQNMSSQKQ